MSWNRPWEDMPDGGLTDRQREEIRHRLLDQEAERVTNRIKRLDERTEAELIKIEHLKILHARERALLEQLAFAERDRVQEEKQTRAAVRRLEVEQLKAERTRNRVDGPRRGRPVRVDVDNDAWAVFNRDIIARRSSIVWRLGQLATTEAEQLSAGEVAGSPASRRRRGPGEGTPKPNRRFLRILVADEEWTILRVNAGDTGITISRYIGEIAEIEAHQLGWRAISGNTPRDSLGDRTWSEFGFALGQSLKI